MREQCKNAHKYRAIREPKCGCRTCWDRFFAAHPMYLSYDMKLITDGQAKELETVRGTVYMKQLARFINRYAKSNVR